MSSSQHPHKAPHEPHGVSAKRAHSHDHDDGAHDHSHAAHEHKSASHVDHDHSDHHATGEHEHTDGHGHDHSGQLRQTPAGRLGIALGLTASFMLVEFVGGWLTHSLALLSDAVHMLTDCAALSLALVAQRLALKPQTSERSYGYRRAETIAALLNAIFLCATSLWIAVEAVRRWSAPVPVMGKGMLAIASLGLLVNLLSAWALSTGSHGHNVNTRAAMAHVLSDALGSVAAMVAGALIVWMGWQRADSIASLGVSVLILWGGWRLLGEATDVLMQGTPRSMDVAKIRETISKTPGVCSIHELHVWQLSDGFSVLTVHVVLEQGVDIVAATAAVASSVRDKHKITQVTVQPELPDPNSDDGCLSAAPMVQRKEVAP